MPTITTRKKPRIDQNAAALPKPGKFDVHPEQAGQERQRQHDDAEDREHVQDVVLLVVDHRLVRALQRLDHFLVVVQQVPDPLARIDDVVEVELEVLGQEPLDAALELPQRRALRLDDLAVGDDLLLDLVDVPDEPLRVALVQLLVDLLELVADLVEDGEAVVVEVVEHLVQQPARAAPEEVLAELLVLRAAPEQPRDRPQLDRRQRDEVVGAEERVELAGVEAADRLVVDGEVEDGEEVGLALLGVHVHLGALAPRHHVLDVERMPAEPRRERERLLLRRRLEVDPGQAGVLKLSDARPLRDLRLTGRQARRDGSGCEEGSAPVLRGSAVADAGIFAMVAARPCGDDKRNAPGRFEPAC